MIHNYKEAEKFLDTFVNYEKKAFFSYKNNCKLERVFSHFESLNVPYRNLKTIHIAGTKGKGSCAHFCANILSAAGVKVGLYTSPHILNFRERIKIVSPRALKHGFGKNFVQDKMISPGEVVRILESFRKKLKKAQLPQKLGKISFFEIYTALAFKYFAQKKLKINVIETGLGGRLDATNVVNPLVSIITHIGYDHTDKLGNRLESIAYEKAGIIKENTPVVSAAQRPAVLKVLKKTCKEKKTVLFILGRDFKISNLYFDRNFSSFDFSFKDYKIKGIKIFLKGHCQAQNCALALAACLMSRNVNIPLFEDEIKKRLASARIEARFELVRNNPPVILDIAHNRSSFSALADNIRGYLPGKKVIFVFACSQDKNSRKMLEQIDYDKIIVTSFKNSRCMKPQEIADLSGLKGAFIINDSRKAFGKALNLCTGKHAIVVSGSIFLISEAKKFFRRYKKGFCSGQDFSMNNS
jgi:dihydrofolate synthase/folylpolyglutamate synthase